MLAERSRTTIPFDAFGRAQRAARRTRGERRRHDHEQDERDCKCNPHRTRAPPGRRQLGAIGKGDLRGHHGPSMRSTSCVMRAGSGSGSATQGRLRPVRRCAPRASARCATAGRARAVDPATDECATCGRVRRAFERIHLCGRCARATASMNGESSAAASSTRTTPPPRAPSLPSTSEPERRGRRSRRVQEVSVGICDLLLRRARLHQNGRESRDGGLRAHPHARRAERDASLPWPRRALCLEALQVETPRRDHDPAVPRARRGRSQHFERREALLDRRGRPGAHGHRCVHDVAEARRARGDRGGHLYVRRPGARDDERGSGKRCERCGSQFIGRSEELGPAVRPMRGTPGGCARARRRRA